jgi:hypothetical protein
MVGQPTRWVPRPGRPNADQRRRAGATSKARPGVGCRAQHEGGADGRQPDILGQRQPLLRGDGVPGRRIPGVRADRPALKQHRSAPGSPAGHGSTMSRIIGPVQLVAAQRGLGQSPRSSGRSSSPRESGARCAAHGAAPAPRAGSAARRGRSSRDHGGTPPGGRHPPGSAESRCRPGPAGRQPPGADVPALPGHVRHSALRPPDRCARAARGEAGGMRPGGCEELGC